MFLTSGYKSHSTLLSCITKIVKRPEECDMAESVAVHASPAAAGRRSSNYPTVLALPARLRACATAHGRRGAVVPGACGYGVCIVQVGLRVTRLPVGQEAPGDAIDPF